MEPSGAAVPLFSVVVPCHDYGGVLERAVESVLRQPGEDFEILILDDGSTDDTDAVARALVDQHPSIRHLRHENRGPAATRNRGIDESRGRYLVFLDADDELDEGALSRVAELVRADPAARVVVGGFASVGERGEREVVPARSLPEDGVERFRLYVEKRVPLANGAVFFHRDVFERLRYPEAFRGGEDIPVFGQALALFPTRTLDESLAVIHRHADSLRHSLDGVESAGVELVERLFDPAILPAPCLRFRDDYLVRRHLSLFRTLYLAGEHRRARAWYVEALRLRPSAILRLSYLGKFLRALFG